MLPRIRPMRLRLVKEPFDDLDYLFELKHDGFRAVAYFQNGECKLVSRNLKTLRFESLMADLAKLPVRNAIVDGEIVCLDERGVSRFNKLLSRKAEPETATLQLQRFLAKTKSPKLVMSVFVFSWLVLLWLVYQRVSSTLNFR